MVQSPENIQVIPHKNVHLIYYQTNVKLIKVKNTSTM